MVSDISAMLKGQLLMAMPLLADPNFSKTVTCICEHSATGALGIVINRQDAVLTAKDIFNELNVEFTTTLASTPIHIGGPVHMDELFVLHGPPFDWQGCLQFTPGLAMSNTLDILKAIAVGQGPQRFMLALGCAGWGPGQLENELKENTWLTGEVDEKIVFETPIDERWDSAMRRIGVDPALLSGTAGHA